MAAKNHRSAGALTLNERIVVPWRSLGWLLAAALATVHVWMLYRFAVDFPFQDDFTQVLAVPGAVAHRAALLDKIAYLFSSSVEHRIATLRVIALVQGTLLGGLNFRGLIYFGNALAAAAGLLLLLQAPASQRAWLAPLITALLFSPTNFVAQYWTTAALAHFGVIAYALGAHCCLARGGLARSASGLLLGLAAAFTLANGLMVFPVGTVMLWASGRIRAASIWMLLTFVLFGLYFFGYESTGGESRFDALEHPFRLAVAYLCALARWAASSCTPLAWVS